MFTLAFSEHYLNSSFCFKKVSTTMYKKATSTTPHYCHLILY